MDLSDFFNSINKTKINVVTDDRSEKAYVPYVMNKSFSYHKDAVFHSNLMNGNPILDKKMQYDYYLYTLSKASRFGKWQKADDSILEPVMTYYGYSMAKARQVMGLLPESHLEALKRATDQGGKP